MQFNRHARRTRDFTALLLLVACTDSAFAQAAGSISNTTPVAVRFVVAIPGTGDAQGPEEIFCSTSVDGWPAGGRSLKRVAPGIYDATFQFNTNAAVEYKFCREKSWRSVEKDANGEEISNRKLTLEATQPQSLVVFHAVIRWADGGANAPFAARFSTLVESAVEKPVLGLVDNFHAIREGRAYRSAQLTSEKLAWVIEHHKIRTVINLRGPNPKMEWYPQEVALCEKTGVRLIDIPLSASQLPPPERLAELFDAFQTAPEPILLHCRSGADRSSMAAALWRMTKLDDSAQAALAELSLKYGHIPSRYPKMMEMVKMFQPKREWITGEYTQLYQQQSAGQKADADDD